MLRYKCLDVECLDIAIVCSDFSDIVLYCISIATCLDIECLDIAVQVFRFQVFRYCDCMLWLWRHSIVLHQYCNVFRYWVFRCCDTMHWLWRRSILLHSVAKCLYTKCLDIAIQLFRYWVFRSCDTILWLWRHSIILHSVAEGFEIAIQAFECWVFNIAIVCSDCCDTVLYGISRRKSFLEAGFRPLCPPFVYFVPLSRTKPAFWISTRTAPGSISQVLPGCRVRHPQYSKKLFVRYRKVFGYWLSV